MNDVALSEHTDEIGGVAISYRIVAAPRAWLRLVIQWLPVGLAALIAAGALLLRELALNNVSGGLFFSLAILIVLPIVMRVSCRTMRSFWGVALCRISVPRELARRVGCPHRVWPFSVPALATLIVEDGEVKLVESRRKFRLDPIVGEIELDRTATGLCCRVGFRIDGVIHRSAAWGRRNEQPWL